MRRLAMKQSMVRLGMGLLALTLVSGSLAGATAQADQIYWTDQGTHKIQRSNLDGSGIQDLVTGLPDPAGFGLDASGGKMYWGDGDAHKVQRANLDGSGVEDLVTGLARPYGMALDAAGGKMYWTDQGSSKVQRANLDGSGVEDLVTGLFQPFGIAISPVPEPSTGILAGTLLLGIGVLYWRCARRR